MHLANKNKFSRVCKLFFLDNVVTCALSQYIYIYGTEMGRFEEKGRENPFVMSKTRLSAWLSLTEWCLPWWKAYFFILDHTHILQGGNMQTSQLRLVDYVKYAGDVWETDIFCLMLKIMEIKSKQTDSLMISLTPRFLPLWWSNEGEYSHITVNVTTCIFHSRREYTFYEFDITDSRTPFYFKYCSKII